MPKVQRVRDPVHNLIEFGATNRELELILWDVIQTPPFQRLRRIKQLGFSEFVFPGATHTRFAHSIGVFHAARLLLGSIERSMSQAGTVFGKARAQHALAAALVHDVGHGMFSHAFEAVGKALNLPLGKHETVSDRLIRDSEITRAFDDRLGTGFASNVADLIAREQPRDVYDSVVTSQFDADRLDYMQRDRMMTGVHSGAVDVTWLLKQPGGRAHRRQRRQRAVPNRGHAGARPEGLSCRRELRTGAVPPLSERLFPQGDARRGDGASRPDPAAVQAP